MGPGWWVALLTLVAVANALPVPGDVELLQESSDLGCEACQILSHKYGISHGSSWGNADSYAKACWVEQACKTVADVPARQPQKTNTSANVARALRAEREREWEANAHRDLVRQMHSELKDVKAQVPRETKFARTMIKPLKRLQQETSKLAEKENAALKQESFVEKNMEHLENQVTRETGGNSALGESNTLQPLAARVKQIELNKLAASIRSVKSEEANAAKATSKQLSKYESSKEATKKQLHRELAFEQNEASSLIDLANSEKILSHADKPLIHNARKLNTDSKRIASKFQQEVEQRRSASLGEAMGGTDQDDKVIGEEKRTLHALKAKKAEVQRLKGMEGEAIEVAARAHDAAIEAEQQSDLSENAMKQAGSVTSRVAHRMLARAGMNARTDEQLGEAGPTSVMLDAEKQIVVNAERAKDKLVIHQAIVDAKQAAQDKLEEQTSEMKKQHHKANAERSALKSEQQIEGDFVQQLAGANGALRRGEEDERLAHTSAADVQRRIGALVKRIQSSAH